MIKVLESVIFQDPQVSFFFRFHLEHFSSPRFSNAITLLQYMAMKYACIRRSSLPLSALYRYAVLHRNSYIRRQRLGDRSAARPAAESHQYSTHFRFRRRRNQTLGVRTTTTDAVRRRNHATNVGYLH